MSSSVYKVLVQWGDCDPARIVYYPNFFSWFDAATRHLFETNGLSWAAISGEHGSRGFPLVDARASFRRPARFGDELEIETTLKRWGRSSFDLQHVIRIKGDVAVEGSETRIWGIDDPANPEVLRAGRVPDAIKAKIPAATA
jgi:4-hydroxybenzoyl-CoA thioesterase